MFYRIQLILLLFFSSFILLNAQDVAKDTIPYKIGKYDIKKQEKVFVVAQKLKVDPNIIVKLNKLRNIKQDLVVGQRIKIPVYPKGYVYQPEKAIIHKTSELDSAKLALLYADSIKDAQKLQSPLQFFNAEEDKTRLMMLDAMLELNEAMMQGIQASFDSLNVEDGGPVDEKNIQAMLKKMKRSRERVLLTPYLEHVRDSLTTEITQLKEEKKTIETRLNPTPAPIVKVDTVVTENDTIVYEIKTFADNRPAEKTVAAVMVKDDIIKDDKTKIELKRNDQKRKKARDYYAVDTVIVFDLPLSNMKPAPELKSMRDGAPIQGIWDTAKAIEPLTEKSQWDTARAINPLADTSQKNTLKPVDVRKDTTIAIKIKLPNSNDSIIIKPIVKPIVETPKVDTATVAININPPLFDTVSAAQKNENVITPTIDTTQQSTVQIADTSSKQLIDTTASTKINVQVIDTITTKDTVPAIAKSVVQKQSVLAVALSNTDSVRKIKAEFFFKRSQKAYTEKNFRNAEQYLRKAIELYPAYFDAWFALAEMDALFGSPQVALKEYKICEAIDSTQPKLYLNMGSLYAKIKRKTDAFNAFNKALALSPENIQALTSRASIYTDWKKYAEAISDYDRVISINRAYHYAYKARGQVKLLTRDFATAIDDFTRFLIFEETDPSAYYYRGLAKIGNNELLEGCMDLSTSAEMGYTAAEKAIKRSCE